MSTGLSSSRSMSLSTGSAGTDTSLLRDLVGRFPVVRSFLFSLSNSLLLRPLDWFPVSVEVEGTDAVPKLAEAKGVVISSRSLLCVNSSGHSKWYQRLAPVCS